MTSADNNIYIDQVKWTPSSIYRNMTFDFQMKYLFKFSMKYVSNKRLIYLLVATHQNGPHP